MPATKPRPRELVLLNSKATAGLIGLSISTLEHARPDQPWLDVPPCRRFGNRRVGYALGDVLAWSAKKRSPLRWDNVPLSFALQAPAEYAAADQPTPQDLLTRLHR